MEGCPKTLMISFDTKESAPADFNQAISNVSFLSIRKGEGVTDYVSKAYLPGLSLEYAWHQLKRVKEDRKL